MRKDIINKYGKEVYNNFWIFIEQLKFDSKKQDASSVRSSILKMLSPALADKYKDLGDELAFSLYREVFSDKKNTYLYASFEALSKGLSFYEKCWETPEIIEPIVDSLDRFNNFSAVLPTEDDYFSVNVPSPEEVWDEYAEYDYNLESIGVKKTKKIKSIKDLVED